MHFRYCKKKEGRLATSSAMGLVLALALISAFAWGGPAFNTGSAAKPLPRVESKVQQPSGVIVGTSLYCWSVMNANSRSETQLVRLAILKKTGIAACEEWQVFSNKVTWLIPYPPPVMTTFIPVVFTKFKGQGGVMGTLSWTNVEVFLVAWDAVRVSGKYLQHDWTVKADPDAVFLTDRLRARLAPHLVPIKKGLYLKNCKNLPNGFFGPLEVMSREAVSTYLLRIPECKATLQWSQWGEDLFAQKCMDKFNVSHAEAGDLLTDSNCGQTPSPCMSGMRPSIPSKTHCPTSNACTRRDDGCGGTKGHWRTRQWFMC